METLTRDDIVAGLSELGLEAGDRVLVHSSLAALGTVEGGADAVIDALLEAVGPRGLVLVPTFYTEQPFDRATSASRLGAIADTFWRRPGAARSIHPTHSIAAIGAGAEAFVADHEKASTAYVDGTPYYRLIEMGGKVLLLGVDHDRSTMLHIAEVLADAPYLGEREGRYRDDAGEEHTVIIPRMAGPHRNFIGLGPLFRARGIERVGRIGSAVCRLLDARAMVEAATEAIMADPAAVLCRNPECADCVMQRGKIKAARLAQEAFTLAAVAGDIAAEPRPIIEALEGEGIRSIEVTPREHERLGEALAAAGIGVAAVRAAIGDGGAIALAGSLGAPLVLMPQNRQEAEWAAKTGQRGVSVCIENGRASSKVYAELYATLADMPPLAFNPRRFAGAGEKPFLQVFYHGPLRRRVARFYIDDGTFDGRPALAGMGNGEVKEIISMLRCRSFSGGMTLRSPERGVAGFRRAAAAFWKLLEEM